MQAEQNETLLSGYRFQLTRITQQSDSRAVREQQIFVQGYILGIHQAGAISAAELVEYEQALSRAVDARLAALA
jgi:hypothetical protein